MMRTSLPWARRQASDHRRRTFQGLPSTNEEPCILYDPNFRSCLARSAWHFLGPSLMCPRAATHGMRSFWMMWIVNYFWGVSEEVSGIFIVSRGSPADRGHIDCRPESRQPCTHRHTTDRSQGGVLSSADVTAIRAAVPRSFTSPFCFQNTYF